MEGRGRNAISHDLNFSFVFELLPHIRTHPRELVVQDVELQLWKDRIAMADHHRRQHGHKSRSPRSLSPAKGHRSQHRGRSPCRLKRKHSPESNMALPFGSRSLTKHDFDLFKPMFALYLDIQKGKVMDDIEEKEAKGRWKSFIGKW